MNKPLELQLSIYDPNQQKIKAAITFNIKPQRRIEIINQGRLDDTGIPQQRIILLTTDKKGALEKWLSTIVIEQ
jgi:hypothetical protein